jgi:hypothetical protein
MMTTLNIDKTLFEIITIQASKRGISRSKLMIKLLRQSMKDVENAGKAGEPVKY